MNAYESNEHLSGASEQEGEGRVRETDESIVIFPGQIHHTKDTNREEDHENGNVGVLFCNEKMGALIKVVILFNPKGEDGETRLKRSGMHLLVLSGERRESCRLLVVKDFSLALCTRGGRWGVVLGRP